MSKHFAILKQKWTDQAMADKELPRAAVVVIYRLAFGYLNEKTGDCYPAQDTLATDVGVSERQLRNLLAVLCERGHLQIVRVGKKATNRYRPIICDRKSTSAHEEDSDRKYTSDHKDSDRQSIADHEEPLSGNFASVDRKSISSATGSVLPVHSNLLNEPLYPDPLKGIGEYSSQTYMLEETFFAEELDTEDRALERATSRPEEEPDPVKPPVYRQGETIQIDGYAGNFDIEHVFSDRVIAHSSYSDERIMFDLDEDGVIDPMRTLLIETAEEYEHAIGF